MEHSQMQTMAISLRPSGKLESWQIFVGIFVDGGATNHKAPGAIIWCRCKRESKIDVVVTPFRLRMAEKGVNIQNKVISFNDKAISDLGGATFGSIVGSETQAMLLIASDSGSRASLPSSSTPHNRVNVTDTSVTSINVSDLDKGHSSFLSRTSASGIAVPTQSSAGSFATATSQNAPPRFDVERARRKLLGSTSFQLQKDFEGTPFVVSEQAVKQGVEMLETLTRIMQQRGHKILDAHTWLGQIEQVQKKAAGGKTIIGLVGNTGAGKSSLLNAICDQERLVPTSCMRACTAVITELSYNHSRVNFRAEVDFVDAADWRRELGILHDEFVEGQASAAQDDAGYLLQISKSAHG
jgi:hypothetical protein